MVVEVHNADRRGHEIDTASIEVFGAAVVDMHDVVGAFGGDTVAVLGTRLVASFPAAQVGDCFDAAVVIQRRAANVMSTDTQWRCSIGLATGDVLDTPSFAGLGVPLLGGVFDRALLLCSWGQSGAVVADGSTVTPALGQDVAAATATDTAARQWSLGPSEVLAGQASSAIECWQLRFDLEGDADPEVLRTYRSSRSGLRGPARPGRGDSVPARRAPREGAGEKHSSTLLEPERLRQLDQVTAPPATQRRTPAGRRSWSQGRVCCWFGDRGRGVIASSTAQEFYVDRRFLVVSADLKPNATVFFVPRDPVARGRNPVAGAVLVEGARLEARVEHVDERGFGFAELSDSNGTRQLLLLDLSSLAEEITVGDWILVEVRRGQHGPFAVPV